MLAEGAEVPAVSKALEVSEQIYHRWRATYGGVKADEVKRLKELERGNARLKRVVTDKELESDAPRERARRKPGPVSVAQLPSGAPYAGG